MNRPEQAAGRRQAARTFVAHPGPRRRPSRQDTKSPPVGPRGFTLVELLVVIVIIAILAGMSMATLSAARQKARVAKTRATIIKIDQLVQQYYEEFRTRRVTFYEVNGVNRVTGDWVYGTPNPLIPPLLSSAARLIAVRDLMRMEMPERWKDFVDDPTVPSQARTIDFGFPSPVTLTSPPLPANSTWGPYAIKRPSLANAYFRRFAHANPRPSVEYSSAECLYMWVTLAIPDARERFLENEIGDADADGWREFQDAWGNPIKFLRSAPGFRDSDVQQNVVWDSSLSDQANREARKRASEADHDPFDTRGVDIDSDPSDANAAPRGGWRLVPLIYSAGPDKIYGIDISKSLDTVGFDGNPYVFEVDPSSGWFKAAGAPVKAGIANLIPNGPRETNGPDDYLDNIHNHRIEATR